MSKDLLHQMDWDKTHPTSRVINTTEGEYSILVWSCGMGWTFAHTDLSLKEARTIKRRYKSTITSARIVLEVK